MILLFITGLRELGEVMLPVLFKEITARLTQQKNYLDVKIQTWVQPRNTLNDSLNEELKVWSLPECRGRTGKIKETRGMSSSQNKGLLSGQGAAESRELHCWCCL